MNSLQLGDCVAGMNGLPAGSVDLAFADPPFNIGYKYDVYDDRREHEHYLDWSKQWIAAVHRALKPDGTFWLAIGDEYAAELKLLSQDIGFRTRSWVIWYYTFGVNCKQKFTRSHAHLFYFVKDETQFTFRSEELENRVPSARQLIYNDSRSNLAGRLPDDTWILRPQDLMDGFCADEDTWYIPRVAGTFKERAGFHGCQMPEQLLGRIIRLCSKEGELVLDPFSGSATTLAVAKKLGRKYVGFDLSPEYVERGQARLKGIKIGDRLDGTAEPLLSTSGLMGPQGKPSTRKKKSGEKAVPAVIAQAEEGAIKRSVDLVRRGIKEAFVAASQGFSADRVVADPELAQAFADECRKLDLPGSPRDWNLSLLNLRKAGALKSAETAQRTELDWETFDQISFASEIALQELLNAGAASLDEVLCDPDLVAEFDRRAMSFAPGHRPLDYRWAALKLRKEAKNARTRAQSLLVGRLSEKVALGSLVSSQFPTTGGLFAVHGAKQVLYVGESLNLRQRVEDSFGARRAAAWRSLDIVGQAELSLSYLRAPGDIRSLLGYQCKLVEKHKPRFNFGQLATR
jgi:site-specific DNA-methyltransferase (adenine-specific)